MKNSLWQQWFPTIRSRLLVVLVACVLLPLAGGQFWMQKVTRRQLEASEMQKYRSLAMEAARQVRGLMGYAAGNLSALSENSLLRSTEMPLYTEADWIKAVKAIADAGRFWTDISLFNTRGDIITSTSEDYAEPVERTSWFARAVAGETVMAPPSMVHSREGRLECAVYVPVELPASKKKLVARGRVKFDPVTELLSEMDLGAGHMVLLDPRGTALFHPEESQRLRRYQGPGDNVTPAQDSGEAVDKDGRDVFWIARHIPADQTCVGDPWTLLTIVPKDQVLALASVSSFIHLGAGLLTLLSVIALGYSFAHRSITHPMIAAGGAAQRLASGDTSTRMNESSGPQEVRQLASAFNAMIREVAHHQDDLEKLVDMRTRGLQEQQERAETLSTQLHAAFEATEEALLILRHDGVVLGANGQFSRFFGARADLLLGTDFGRWMNDFFGCFAETDAFSKRWKMGAAVTGEAAETHWHVSKPARRILDVYASRLASKTGELLGHLWVFRDLTHERELQDSLEQAQKMEAIGRLAGGVAHDFNNLLTGIIGNLSLAEGHLTKAGMPEPSYHVHYAKSAAERAAHLVKSLLGFSRRSHLQLTYCGLNQVVRDFHPLIQRIIDPRISIRLQLAEDLWGVHADQGKFEQVLMNLCVNARDAIDSSGGSGSITVTTHNEALPQDLLRPLQTQAGDHVCLSVTDTGCGIPAELIGKIFEPFFTTKEQGKGTGLGLATSYGIVRQHGGWMECESTVGEGTTFRVFLPRNEYVEPKSDPAEADQTDIRGDETILLVDDEIMVRMVAETLLKSNGYKILTAVDGQEAVEIFTEHQDEISLVLMDMTMPRMSGLEAFRALRELDRMVPVVICSGYVVDLGEFQTEQGDRPNGFVQKPYNLRDLVTTVRHLIDASATQSKRRYRSGSGSPALSI